MLLRTVVVRDPGHPARVQGTRGHGRRRVAHGQVADAQSGQGQQEKELPEAEHGREEGSGGQSAAEAEAWAEVNSGKPPTTTTTNHTFFFNKNL